MIFTRHISALMAVVLCSGCVEVQRTIRLERDGSGTLTEEIRFEDHLLAMARGAKELQTLTDGLRPERLNERLPLFGDVALVSYDTREREGVVCEARAVFSFKDVNDIRIPAFPGRAPNWPQQGVRFNLQPPIVWQGGYYGFATFFQMPLGIQLEPPPQAIEPGKDPRAPLDRERLRSLLPVVRTALRGFRWTLAVEAFGAVGGKGSTGTSTRHIVFDVRDKDLDDDETLLRVIEWNRYPDQRFAWNELLGLADGRILNENRTVVISFNSPPAQQEPDNPLSGLDRAEGRPSSRGAARPARRRP